MSSRRATNLVRGLTAKLILEIIPEEVELLVEDLYKPTTVEDAQWGDVTTVDVVKDR